MGPLVLRFNLLDIDYPCDVSQVLKIATKPEPMSYSTSRIPIRIMVSYFFEAFDKLKTMEPGAERDAFVRSIANQMKRSLVQWGHGSSDDEKYFRPCAFYEWSDTT